MPAAPPPAPQRSVSNRSSNSDPPRELAEIVLECISADGVALTGLPQNQRAITLRVEAGKSGSVSIGRQQQIEFFERLVPQKDRLMAISRVHFELTWNVTSAGASVCLKKVSANPLLVNNQRLAPNATSLLQDGTHISFSTVNDDLLFLELRVSLRNSGTQTPRSPPAQAVANAPALRASGGWQQGTVALLECTKAMGIDVSSLPLAQRVIELSLDGAVDIGKSKQPEFFTRLLEAEPKWLSFISRAHCRAQLSYKPFPSRAVLDLAIENLSVNVVLVADRKVAKGQSECINEGGTFSFVAAPDGDGPTEIKFLEFVLRDI